MARDSKKAGVMPGVMADVVKPGPSFGHSIRKSLYSAGVVATGNPSILRYSKVIPMLDRLNARQIEKYQVQRINLVLRHAYELVLKILF